MTPTPKTKLEPKLLARIESTVDKVPDMKPLGLIVAFDDELEILRRPMPRCDLALVIELKESEVHKPPATKSFWQKPSFWNQLKDVGFNCGGAALAYAGAVGFGAAAPVTGGTSAIGSLALYAGATAAAAQCGVSVGKYYNEWKSGWEGTANDVLDEKKAPEGQPFQMFVVTMKGMDWIGLIGAGMALKDLHVAHRATLEFGLYGGNRAKAIANLDPVRRRALLDRLGVEKKLWEGADKINDSMQLGRIADTMLQKRLLDGFAAAIGAVGPFVTGNGLLLDIVAAFIQFNRETDARHAQDMAARKARQAR